MQIQSPYVFPHGLYWVRLPAFFRAFCLGSLTRFIYRGGGQPLRFRSQFSRSLQQHDKVNTRVIAALYEMSNILLRKKQICVRNACLNAAGWRGDQPQGSLACVTSIYKTLGFDETIKIVRDSHFFDQLEQEEKDKLDQIFPSFSDLLDVLKAMDLVDPNLQEVNCFAEDGTNLINTKIVQHNGLNSPKDNKKKNKFS